MKVYVLESGVYYEGQTILDIWRSRPSFRDVKLCVAANHEKIKLTEVQYLELVDQGEIEIEKDYRWLSLKEMSVRE